VPWGHSALDVDVGVGVGVRVGVGDGVEHAPEYPVETTPWSDDHLTQTWRIDDEVVTVLLSVELSSV
jgi:hypothetical protein